MLAVGLLAGGVTGTANAADNNTYDLWFGDSQMYGQGIEGDAVRSEKRFSKLVSDADNAIVLREGTPSFRTVGNHAGLFWFSMYRFSVSNGAPPAVPA